MKKNNWFIIKGLITKNKKESFLKFLHPIEIDIYEINIERIK